MKKSFVFLLTGFILLSCVGCSEDSKKNSDLNITKSESIINNGGRSGKDNEENSDLNVTKGKSIINDVDYSANFGDFQGCAVFYDYGNNRYDIYNKEKCEMQYSPCSTFKIISTLEGLESGVINSEESKMNYSGYKYELDFWNEDVNLKNAFQKSCVWYYRQVIDKVGQDKIGEDLKKLGYGNCDISQWEGSNINETPDTNGFWLESSLKISPIENATILSDIFEGKTDYNEDNIKILKNVMVTDYENFYGKTGAGNSDNAWYVGFSEKDNKRIYFAVHLDGGKDKKPAGADAREIAYNIINNYYNK